MVERAAADAVARLEHEHRMPGGLDLTRRAEAGQAGADDDHVGVARSARAARAAGAGGVCGTGRAGDGNGAGGGCGAAEQLAAADLRLGLGRASGAPYRPWRGTFWRGSARLGLTWTDGVATAAWQ